MRVSIAAAIFVFCLLLPAQADKPTCIRDIKCYCCDGEIVEAVGIVTACFEESPGCYCSYIEQENGLSGIKVRDFGGVVGIFYVFASDCCTYGLEVHTDEDGEKELVYLPMTPVASMPANQIPLMFYINRCIGGGPLCCPPDGKIGQCGVCGCCGLNNIGLLVSTCGQVTCVDEVKRCFYIDDGSCRCDGTGPSGVRVSWAGVPGGTLDPTPGISICPVICGDYVKVTGISSIFKNSLGEVHSVIRLRDPSDVVWHYWSIN